MFNAARSVLGADIRIQGRCYYVAQSVWRQMQCHGLSKAYMENDDVALSFGRLVAVAFPPLADVSAGLAHVRAIAPQGVLAVLDYFDSAYVSGAGGRSPTSPPSIWNARETTTNDGRRTNNICGGRNNGFANLVGHKHPSVWQLVDKMRRENGLAEAVASQHDMGQAPRKRADHVLVEFQVRMRTLCAEYQNGQRALESLLRAAGRNARP